MSKATAVKGNVQGSGVRNLGATVGVNKLLDVRHVFGKECRVLVKNVVARSKLVRRKNNVRWVKTDARMGGCFYS